MSCRTEQTCGHTPQQLTDLLRRQQLAELIALACVATGSTQRRELLSRLDAFGRVGET